RILVRHRACRALLVVSGLAACILTGYTSDLLKSPAPATGISWGYPLVALGCVAIVCGFLTDAPGLLLGNPVLVYLGKISYGLYVFHYFALTVGREALLQIKPSFVSAAPWQLVSWIFAFALTLILAACSYRWLETPFLRLKERFAVVPSRPVQHQSLPLFGAISSLNRFDVVE